MYQALLAVPTDRDHRNGREPVMTTVCMVGTMTRMDHAAEVSTGARFAFGDNWARFLANLDEARVAFAVQSLRDMLGVEDLRGRRFLDIGSGSGLFSLAAHRLGATVHSFDYDPASVACTAELRRHFGDERWTVETGSVLDDEYLRKLGEWDVVYSWGVLHHTGNLRAALAAVAPLVRDGGQLFIAIYNDQGRASRTWLAIKKAYNALPRALRWIVLGPALLRLWGPTTVRDLVRGRPLSTWRNYTRTSRGMSAWRDVIDWVGGLPFEVATPELIFDTYRARGFQLQRLKTCAGGHGCNEFVLSKDSASTMHASCDVTAR
jgi:2-polyprenyl-3-methyl-5-hydroxy-6-metoxy-1,4-benzoquinol methylase